MTRIYISIIIYKGSPLDYPQYRHTAIWLRFEDGSPSLLVHVVGPSGGFEFESKRSSDPSESQRFAKRIDIGYLTIDMTPAQIVQVLQRVPINNRDREFNCQTWVEDALSRFKHARGLSTELYDRGVNGMVDAIDEAEDTDE